MIYKEYGNDSNHLGLGRGWWILVENAAASLVEYVLKRSDARRLYLYNEWYRYPLRPLGHISSIITAFFSVMNNIFCSINIVTYPSSIDLHRVVAFMVQW